MHEGIASRLEERQQKSGAPWCTALQMEGLQSAGSFQYHFTRGMKSDRAPF